MGRLLLRVSDFPREVARLFIILRQCLISDKEMKFCSGCEEHELMAFATRIREELWNCGTVKIASL